MLNRWVVLLFALSVWFMTACMHEAEPWKVKPQERQAEPQRIYFGGVQLTEFVLENQNFGREAIVEQLRAGANLNDNGRLTGFASLINRNLENIVSGFR